MHQWSEGSKVTLILHTLAAYLLYAAGHAGKSGGQLGQGHQGVLLGDHGDVS